MLARTLISESVLPIRRILSGLGTRLESKDSHDSGFAQKGVIWAPTTNTHTAL